MTQAYIIMLWEKSTVCSQDVTQSRFLVIETSPRERADLQILKM